MQENISQGIRHGLWISRPAAKRRRQIFAARDMPRQFWMPGARKNPGNPKRIDQVYLRLHVLPFQLGHIQRVQRLRAADGFECAEARPPQQPRRQSQRDDDRRSVSLQTFHFQFLQHKCFLLRGQPLFPIRTYFLYCSRICACAPRFFCISAQLLQAETKRRGRSRGPACMA